MRIAKSKFGISSLALLAVVFSSAVNSNAAVSAVARAACVRTSSQWLNTPLPQAQSQTFRITFDATPSAINIDSVTGLSSGLATAYSSLAAVVRFNSTGTIDG